MGKLKRRAAIGLHQYCLSKAVASTHFQVLEFSCLLHKADRTHLGLSISQSRGMVWKLAWVWNYRKFRHHHIFLRRWACLEYNAFQHMSIIYMKWCLPNEMAVFAPCLSALGVTPPPTSRWKMVYKGSMPQFLADAPSFVNPTLTWKGVQISSQLQ